jgi:CMP-N,N'-diacetyllegionaminic acid synthase
VLDVIALIPARGGSVRVKNKNLAILGELSLIARKVVQLKKAGIDKVYVGSDSLEILEEAERFGAIPIMRDPVACDESLSNANAMIADFANRVDGDIAIWAHCTNPFLYSKHYADALEMFKQKVIATKIYDSLISVTKIQSHMWNAEQRPENYNPWAESHTLARDLQPVYFQDGGIFIQNLSDFKMNSYFFGKNPYLYEVDYISSFDINFPEELEMANVISNGLDAKNDFAR